VLVVSGVCHVTAAQVLDGECDRRREDHSTEDAKDEEEGGHHSGDGLLLPYHVPAISQVHNDVNAKHALTSAPIYYQQVPGQNAPMQSKTPPPGSKCVLYI